MRPPRELGGSPYVQRRTLVVLGVIAAIIVLLIVLNALSGFYVNFLWFHYVGLGTIWRGVTETKIELGVVFIVIAIALIWVCLLLVDKISSRALFTAPDNELVRRYQSIVGPHAFAVRTIVAVIVGAIIGSSAPSQWQHWILFQHAVAFPNSDPQFHKNVSFFVFRLPFLSYLVDWIFVALLISFIVSVISYFVNGAISLQGAARIEPRAVAHLSLLLGLMALERAWAYYFVDRFGLDLSHNGYVSGAGWTDVHVRLPAMTLLAVISLIAFIVLIFNVYHRTLVLPAIAVGLWAFLAIVIGAIYPGLIQAFKVTPAQSSLEIPYIQRNITATRAAMNISNVDSQNFPANQDLTQTVLNKYSTTINDTQLWDPVFSYPTFTKLQQARSFYKLTDLSIDRYEIDGKLTPVDVGVRELSSSGVPSQSWVNTHLGYTHGDGAVVSPSNAVASGGNPGFVQGNVPPTSTASSVRITQPEVYFAPGDEQYVVADTKQPELQPGSTSGIHYAGNGGVPVGSFLNKLAFSIHLHDFNLLISSLITSKSRLIYLPDVESRVQKALPFLRVDSNPYAVIDNGQIDWVLDAYTTTSYYPYAQSASSNGLEQGSGLQGNYNYVRDAVKVVVNAYTGKMQFYAIDAKADPLMLSYEEAFPGLFKPMSEMDSVLKQHLRYPQDLLMVQSAMYGRYHITSPQAFYNLNGLWDLSQTTTTLDGSPSGQLPINASTGSVERFTPIYELLQLPGARSLSFNVIEPLVPYSQQDKLQTLSDLFLADSSAASYGKLTSYVVPSGAIHGPGLANSDIKSDPTVSSEITLLDRGGSVVALGTVQVLPIEDSLLYVRPLYVSSSQTAYPLLVDVIVVYGSQVSMEPTLSVALAKIFGGSSGSNSGSSTSSGSSPISNAAIPADVRQDILNASKAYANAQTALTKGDLGAYQSDVSSAAKYIADANRLLTEATTTPKGVPTITVPSKKINKDGSTTNSVKTNFRFPDSKPSPTSATGA